MFILVPTQQYVYTCSYSTTCLFLFLLRSGLQLLTSSASHGSAYSGGGAGERAVVERISKHLVRSGRDRDAATLDSLATKLAASSRDILKNRASILTLLYSLSKDAGCNKENQVHSSYQ